MKEEVIDYKEYKLSKSDLPWPLFVRPKYDELFSSWLYRIACAHYVKPHSFYNLNFPGIPIWNRDIDRSASPNLINLLTLKTDTSFDIVNNTLLTSYIPNLFLSHEIKGITKWIMPSGIFHRTRKRYGLMYCPSCLNIQNKQYFKKQWRLSFIVCCPDCRVILHDRCPNCESSIIFFRSGINQKVTLYSNEITKCYNCLFDLRNSPIKKADERIVRYQEYLYNSVLTGINDISIYSHLYFAGLSALFIMFTSKEKRTLQFRKYILSEYNLGNDESYPTTPFDYLSIKYRYEIMLIVSILMSDWPHNFISTCTKSGILSSGMLKDKKYFPYWYYRVVKENFYVYPFTKRWDKE